MAPSPPRPLSSLRRVLPDPPSPTQPPSPTDACHSHSDLRLASAIPPADCTLVATRSAFYKRYCSEIVTVHPCSIGPLTAVYPAKLTDDGCVPVLIHSPSHMPERRSPWIVSAQPCAPIGPGTRVDLPVLGRASVDVVVEDVQGYYIFRLTTKADRSRLYLLVPRQWAHVATAPVTRAVRSIRGRIKRSIKIIC